MNTILMFIGLFIISIAITLWILSIAVVIIIERNNAFFNFTNSGGIRLTINSEGKMLEIHEKTLAEDRENLSRPGIYI